MASLSPPPVASAGLPLPPTQTSTSSISSLCSSLLHKKTYTSFSFQRTTRFTRILVLLGVFCLVWWLASYRFFRSRSQTSGTTKLDLKNWEKSLKNLRVSDIVSIGTSPTKPGGVLTCGRSARDETEEALIREFRYFLTKKRRGKKKHITLILASGGVLDSVAYLIDSLHENAREMFDTTILVCVGQETLNVCKEKWGKSMGLTCVLDASLSRHVSPQAKEDGLSTSQRVNDAYLSLIWRKPELLYLSLLAGADSAMVLDTDGLVFRDLNEEEWADPVPARSSTEFMFTIPLLLNSSTCSGIPHARGAPLMLNSGTVIMNFRRPETKDLLESWMKTRAEAYDNAGRCEPTNNESLSSFLDQDGWNLVACKATDLVRIFTSNQVMLNSYHHQARNTVGYDLCKVFYFHATNCGRTQDKASCLQRNLQRWKDANCQQHKTMAQ